MFHELIAAQEVLDSEKTQNQVFSLNSCTFKQTNNTKALRLFFHQELLTARYMFISHSLYIAANFSIRHIHFETAPYY